MNKFKKEIKRKKYEERQTDNIRLKKMLLKEIMILQIQQEATYEYIEAASY